MNELRLILIVFGVFLLVAIYLTGRRDEQRHFEHSLPKNPGFSPESDLNESIEGLYDDTPNVDEFTIKDLENHIKQQFHHDEQDLIYRINQSDKAPKISMSGLHAQDSSAAQSESVIIPENAATYDVVEIPPDLNPMVVVLSVLAFQGKQFNGLHLKDCMESAGLELGEMNIYHYYRKPITELKTQSAKKMFSVANAIQPGRFDPNDLQSYYTSGVAFFMQLPGPIDGILTFEKMLQTAESLAKRLGGMLCDEKHNKLTSQTVAHIKDQISDYNLKLQLSLKRTVH